MKKRSPLKPIIALALAVVVSACMLPGAASAQDSRAEEPVWSDYQHILDKYNDIYGTDFAFCTPQDRIDIGEDPFFGVDELGTLEEFDAFICFHAKEISAMNAAAERELAAIEEAYPDAYEPEYNAAHIRDETGKIIATQFWGVEEDGFPQTESALGEDGFPQTKTVRSWKEMKN